MDDLLTLGVRTRLLLSGSQLKEADIPAWKVGQAIDPLRGDMNWNAPCWGHIRQAYRQ